jgi:hypothetical protein
MTPLARRNNLVALSLVSSIGALSALCVLGTLWALNQTYPSGRLLSRDGPSYHSTCRWYGCTWTVLTSSRFLTSDDVDQVYAWYWNNKRVWDVQMGQVYIRFAFLELGAVQQSPTRYRLDTEVLLVLRRDREP